MKDLLIKGEIFENAVISEILKSLKVSIHWWRTKGGAEVDIIVKKEKERIPVEVKGIGEKSQNLPVL